MTEEEIFHEALARNRPDQRAVYLEQACAGNRALRASVEALLRASIGASGFMDGPAPDLVATLDVPMTERPGTRIGRYKLLEQIGEGGFGVVFMAEQQEPVRRKVALKVIKPGMDTRQVVARFEAERQALALMDHPNIAKVLEAGATDSCRPFFVMELVKGLPITEYCDQNQHTPHARLELFVAVCQAVQHAHQKGIIHRDIKPSNVLVTLHDGTPVVKVIDFGIAKATGQQLTAKTLFTNFAQMIGTPLYMSPEQAALSALDIDTRSDIYSLGVLLYELLTGTTPFDKARFQEVAYDEIRRIIREEEPPRPSTRVSTLGPAQATVSVQRKSDPKRLSQLCRGDLDWIVMKALEKDRNRRYETASGFAADVQRYLNDEPVEACPPSASYRLRKFARRNKAALATSGLVAAALLLGTAVSIWQAVDATEARQLADERLGNEKQARADEERERQKAEHAAEEERKAKQVADERRRQAEAAADLLESVFKNLDPTEETKDGLDLKDRLIAKLDEAAGHLQQEAADPLTQARLQYALGKTYLGLGEANKAVIPLRRSLEQRQAKLGPSNPDTLTSMNGLASAYVDTAKLDLALDLYEQALEKNKAKRPDHTDTLSNMHGLAAAYRHAEQLDKSLPLFKETLEKRTAKLGADHPDTLNTMNSLAVAYDVAGQLELALSLHKQTLETRTFKLGLEHPSTLSSMGNLAVAYARSGRLDLAVPLLVQTREKLETKLGPDHRLTLMTMNSLAFAYGVAGKHALALPLFEKALEKSKAKLGLDHPQTLHTMHGLGVTLWNLGKSDFALPLYEQALESRKRRLGPDHPDTLATMNCLAVAYLDLGKFDRALPLFKQTLEMREAKLGPNHRGTLVTRQNLAFAYKNVGNLDQALPLFEQALEQLKSTSPDHHSTLTTMRNLAGLYENLGQFVKAETFFREALQRSQKQQGPDHPHTLVSMTLLGRNLILQKKYAQAEPVLREYLTIKEKKEPDNTFIAKSLLGGALLGQKKYADAESLLLFGYEGMKLRETKIPATGKYHLTETLERLVQLYDAWGQNHKADEWRQKLKAHREAAKTTAKSRM